MSECDGIEAQSGRREAATGDQFAHESMHRWIEQVEIVGLRVSIVIVVVVVVVVVVAKYILGNAGCDGLFLLAYLCPHPLVVDCEL